MIEYFPYFENRYIAVAASLTGGNALAEFVKMIQKWSVQLGLSINQEKIWEKIIALGMSAMNDKNPSPLSSLEEKNGQSGKKI